MQGEIFQEALEIKELLLRSVTLMRRRVHIGPLPPAHEFRRYNETLKGAADRILKMAESELAHGQQMDRDILAADREIASRGQHYALSATVGLGLAGLILGLTGHDWLGGTCFISALVPVVANFLGSRSTDGPKPDGKKAKRRRDESAAPSSPPESSDDV